jgi:hypothetical protein
VSSPPRRRRPAYCWHVEEGLSMVSWMWVKGHDDEVVLLLPPCGRYDVKSSVAKWREENCSEMAGRKVMRNGGKHIFET